MTFVLVKRRRMIEGIFRECLGGFAACDLLRKKSPQSSDRSRTLDTSVFWHKEPLINYVMSLAHRLHRNQGATLIACARLVKSCNAECGAACEPQRARPEARIYRVALLAKDLGHLLRSASCSCTLQGSQRYDVISQRFLKYVPLRSVSDS